MSLTFPAVWRQRWSPCRSLHVGVLMRALVIVSCCSVIGYWKAPSCALATQAADPSYDGNDSSSWGWSCCWTQDRTVREEQRSDLNSCWEDSRSRTSSCRVQGQSWGTDSLHSSHQSTADCSEESSLQGEGIRKEQQLNPRTSVGMAFVPLHNKESSTLWLVLTLDCIFKPETFSLMPILQEQPEENRPFGTLPSFLKASYFNWAFLILVY